MGKASRAPPFCTRLGGPQSSSGPYQEERILLSLSVTEHRPVTVNYEFYVVQGDQNMKERKKLKEQTEEIHIELLQSEKIT
jgi:hypothetical protein